MAPQVHGFDTFSGLPEDWGDATTRGSYSTHGALPQAPENVRFHVGLFSETLPCFLAEHAGPVRFMNVDCDLRRSASQGAVDRAPASAGAPICKAPGCST